ncbi:hypothetical protein CCACVL1_22378 [Corchorus capsularis]|uniref:Uncharacterized protein n=1 Tax=Corchorus capsularis TaxID=210143 RepID=A0A1R3GZS2_COCAP|nr:hypothetical protein CCACVL1_22378 [Corchorus capsularis]
MAYHRCSSHINIPLNITRKSMFHCDERTSATRKEERKWKRLQ